MDKIKKYTPLVLVIIAWIAFAVLSINYINSFKESSNTSRVTSFIELIGYFIFICSYSYSHVNWIFTNWRKLIVYIANPSVSWKITTVYSVNQINENLTEDIFKDLSSKYSDFKFPNSYNKNLTKYEISVNQNQYVLSIENPDEYEVRISSKYRTSYRNSLSDLYTTYSEVEGIIRSNFIHPTDVSYLLSIELDDFNPFYKVYLNNFEKIDKLNFNMKYELDEGTVFIKNNNISIHSTSLAQIKSISKEYIAISNNNLFN